MNLYFLITNLYPSLKYCQLQAHYSYLALKLESQDLHLDVQNNFLQLLYKINFNALLLTFTLYHQNLDKIFIKSTESKNFKWGIK